MLDFAKGFGFAGAAGALIGLVMVTIIGPTTGGGVFILIAIPILICSVLGGIVGALRGNKGKKKDDKTDDSSDDEDKGE
jgi:hypothetical protein